MFHAKECNTGRSSNLHIIPYNRKGTNLWVAGGLWTLSFDLQIMQCFHGAMERGDGLVEMWARTRVTRSQSNSRAHIPSSQSSVPMATRYSYPSQYHHNISQLLTIIHQSWSSVQYANVILMVNWKYMKHIHTWTNLHVYIHTPATSTTDEQRHTQYKTRSHAMIYKSSSMVFSRLV